jgi:DNA-binding CsgD family transcriptional regulator
VKTLAKFPWAKVHDYLLQVESCATLREFMRTASVEVETLIPFDAAAGIFSTIDGRFLGGVGQPESVGLAYNRFYRTRMPAYFSEATGQDHFDTNFGPAINWRRYRSSEFAVDFMIPNGMSKSLSALSPEQPVSLSVNRSRLAPDFTEMDAAILDVLNQHLGNLYRILQGREDSPYPNLTVQVVSERFRSLSRREAELCCLLTRRLNTSEIASHFFISRRTVERHVENIFAKLNVRSRGQLRTALGVQSNSSRV